MAAITSSSVAIPTFSGLKSAAATAPSRMSVKVTSTTTTTPKLFSIKSSLKQAGAAAAIAFAASAMLSSSALAAEVLLGTDDGALNFVPGNLTVAAGEKITFKNNAGFPHNVVFDEDEIPAGVDASKISMNEESLLNAPGETYSVTLTEKGTYSYYCSPHQGAGMVGKITVN